MELLKNTALRLLDLSCKWFIFYSKQSIFMIFKGGLVTCFKPYFDEMWLD